MPVVGVLAEALVRDEQDAIGESPPQLAERPLDDAVVVERTGPGRVFAFGDAEQEKCPDAQLGGGADFVGESVHAELILPRHRADLLAHAAARADEERQDKIGGAQLGFADEGAQERVRGCGV